jgi:hypothetical protein
MKKSFILLMILTAILIMGYLYNSFYDHLNIQIEVLAQLGFWLTIPLAVTIIVLGITLLINHSRYLLIIVISILISILILCINVYGFFHVTTP